MKRKILALVLVLWAVVCGTAAAGATLVVVTTTGGEASYDERFHAWAATLMDAAGERYGLPEEAIVYLAGDPDQDPGRTHARATRDNVEAALGALAASMGDGATLFVVVIGHGSFRDGVSKVNLPGPDMTAEDFAQALLPFGERPIVFAALTSASGELARALSGPRRVILTATKSGMERNVSVFAQFFVAAFVGDEADVDHDERLSVLEAFNYAKNEVERAYDRDQKLLTEHAVLHDDGELAASLMLTGATRATVAGASADDPELARLYQEKADLEQDVADLRRLKESLTKEDYENQLEELLIRLALVHRAVREREDTPPKP